MGWMRMMGGQSVEYHRQTVVEHGDDFPGQALAYYASRGETPLIWGGSGAGALGLAGAVTAEEYEKLYGPGGARHPVSGERLVSTRRPGMEIVISAHKSVAELGVIGRAEHMHQIMDAERDATLAYLDAVTRRMGGRRGVAAVATPTGGLIYAQTRHATSRAGDPCPHDHVLLANLVEMADGRGGWKAADTTLLAGASARRHYGRPGRFGPGRGRAGLCHRGRSGTVRETRTLADRRRRRRGHRGSLQAGRRDQRRVRP